MLEINETPTTEYDWNVGIPQKVKSRAPKAAESKKVNDVENDIDLGCTEENPDDVVMQKQESNTLFKQNSINLQQQMD